ncbi:MAG: DNA polymerase III subunit beta [Cryomorphaceae bacterium]|nr:DNA polymerase III subunit beta [Cryomorphaceae bacterium]
MKFIASSSVIYKNLIALNDVVSTNNTMPILDNFLLELRPNELRVTASDLETTISTGFEVETESEGEVCVPAKLLVESLKDFPEQPLTFIFKGTDQGCEIISENGKYQIATESADEFPRTLTIDHVGSTRISSDILALAIKNTLFATGNDELRPTMSGVFFQLTPENATFVATDAHKLVRYRRTDVQSEEVAEFIMPKKPLNLLIKSLLPAAEDEVVIEYNQQNAVFASGKMRLVCRLIDGKYPNYEAVIPKENPNHLLIRRATLLESVRRVAKFSSKSANQVKFAITGNELIISAEDPDFNSQAEETLRCDFDGTDMEIGFNSRYLLELINHLDAENMRMEMSQPNRAGIIFPGEIMDKEEDLLMLVMPIMVGS